MLSLLDFGKKRRRVSHRGKKSVRKPPARLLRICKKYHVKTTKKVGRKRVYKPVKELAKQCLRKAKMMKRGHRKTVRRHRGSKIVHHRRRLRRYRPRTSMGRLISRFGASTSSSKHVMYKPASMVSSIKNPMKTKISEVCNNLEKVKFGKRRRTRRSRKVSKASAMKAFRKYYKRNFGSMRRTRLGNGGNPPLWHSMGYEFCPSGMGGVLGANSTGLFPSPCTSMNQQQAFDEEAVALPSYSTSYGRRSVRRRRRTRRRMMAVGEYEKKEGNGMMFGRRALRGTTMRIKRGTRIGSRRHKKKRATTRRRRCY